MRMDIDLAKRILEAFGPGTLTWVLYDEEELFDAARGLPASYVALWLWDGEVCAMKKNLDGLRRQRKDEAVQAWHEVTVNTMMRVSKRLDSIFPEGWR